MNDLPIDRDLILDDLCECIGYRYTFVELRHKADLIDKGEFECRYTSTDLREYADLIYTQRAARFVDKYPETSFKFLDK
jgi:hypothetical protein